MRNKHTPGPWRFDKDNLNIYANGMLAQTYGHTHDGEREANARLIAASPDLLKVLQDFVAFMNDGDTPSEWTLIKEARRAIAKATGDL